MDEVGGESLHRGERGAWVVTTHDWTVGVDRAHLERVRAAPSEFSPGGWGHLVLEVLAYADDEAAARGRRGRATVTVHADGSVEVRDDGRGTDTRVATTERVVRKPVASSQDVRFTEDQPPVLLPDGHPRRGLSVVAALSRWLVHTNRRGEGSWSQRYEHGVGTRAGGGAGTAHRR